MPAPKTRWEEATDRAMRSCVRAFGEGADATTGQGTVTYTPAGGLGYQVDGIFESATETVDLDTGAPALSYTPRFSAPLSEFQAVPGTGDSLVIRGKAYRVAEPEFDGQGNVTLRLHEA